MKQLAKYPKAAEIENFPNWIPRDAWDGFVEARRLKGCPMTSRAVTMTINDLEYLKDHGHDPGLVLNQSEKRGWTGVFQLRPGENYERKSFRQIDEDRGIEQLRELASRTGREGHYTPGGLLTGKAN